MVNEEITCCTECVQNKYILGITCETEEKSVKWNGMQECAANDCKVDAPEYQN